MGLPLADHQKAVAAKVATHCYERTRMSSTVDSNEGERSEEKKCGTVTLRAAACADIEFFKSCPTELQNTSDECVKLRDFVMVDDFY